jgi:hypothetical protein
MKRTGALVARTEREMKRTPATTESAGASAGGAGSRRLSAEGQAAWTSALETWRGKAGAERAERAVLSLGEAVSRERKVRALFSPVGAASGGARLAAGSAGEVQEVLLRALPSGQFLLRGEGGRLVLEWTGPGRPTLESPGGWTVERAPRPRGQPLRWTLTRSKRHAGKVLPELRARVGGRWWPLVHPA